MNIVIDNEFKALIPPLSTEERVQLEENLIADGCRDPLVVWPLPEFTEPDTGVTFRYADYRIEEFETVNGEWRPEKVWDAPDGEAYHLDMWPCILIDGHNRHEICTRLDIPFEVHEIEFSDRSEATEWIIKNQFGRRNISDYQRGVLALKLKPVIEERARERQLASLAQNASVSQKSDEREQPIRTDEAVSELANISRDTIRKVEKIEATAPDEIKALAGAGEVSINLASQFVDLPKEAQDEAISELASISEPAREVIREAVKKAHVANNSGNNEWYTPAKYIALAREVMGSIDTDPATSEIANRTVQAETIFTADDDGRDKPWSGNVWMNPPYAQPLISDFAEAVTQKFLSGEIKQACVLVNNATETQWFQRMLEAAKAVCFPRSRIRFVDPDGNPSGAPLQGQAIIYMGERAEEFIEAFSVEGRVLINE